MALDFSHARCVASLPVMTWALSCFRQGQAERQQMLVAVDQALQSKQAAPSGSRET